MDNKEFSPKEILDKYVVKVINKNAIFTVIEGEKWGVDQTQAIDYKPELYSDDLVLMYTPINWLRIEFEDLPEHNRNIISIVESQAKSLGYDYCISEHKGAKSPYFNMVGLPHPGDADNWKQYKELIIAQLIPDKFQSKLDRTNLSMTLSPIIGLPHWKPKYSGAVHEVVRGTTPLKQNNENNNILKDMAKKIASSKKKINKLIADIKGKSQWVEDFLLNYCLNNKLPEGQRHSVICKNLAILIVFRADRDTIIQKFNETQKMNYMDFSGWLNGAANGTYTSISVGELKKYIIQNEIPYHIKEYSNPYSIEDDMTETLMDMNIPYANVQQLFKKIPFFYDTSGLYWFWNRESKNWEMKDDTDVLNIIGKAFQIHHSMTDSKLINQYLRAIELVGRQNIPQEPNKTWIQFKDKVIDIKTGEEFESTPKYFFTNPLPYSPGKTSDCKMIDKLFTEWNKEQKQLMYEIVAYCCLMDYPLHFIFMLEGIGSNGKSKFQKLIRRFIGEKHNCCSVDLDVLVDKQFESAKLYRKLVCLMGETNFGVMNKTNKLKALSGQDLVGIEYKGKQPFDTINYAKIIIASNSLPITEDNTDGFFRRWLIINFPNQFKECACPIDDIPDSEFEALSRKCVEILPNLLKKAEFTNQGTIQERRLKYIMVSNPLTEFLKNICIYNSNEFTRYSELYTAYTRFLDKHKKRIISKKSFSDALDREAILVEKNTKQLNGNWVSDRWVIGIQLKHDWKELCDSYDSYDRNLTQLSIGSLSETAVISVTSVIYNDEKVGSNLDIQEEKVDNCIETPENVVINMLKQRKELEIPEDFESTIAKMKQKGIVYEIRPGVVKLL